MLSILLLTVLGCETDGYPFDTGAVPEAFAYTPVEACPVEAGLAYLPPVPPNVMIVIDQSSSMQQHWDDLQALTPYIEAMGDLTQPGLALFPTDGDCGVETAIQVQPGPGTADEILSTIARTEPIGRTPLAEVMEHVRLNGRLQDPYRDNVLIVVGDGAPTCADDAAALQAATRWDALPVPVKMHLISFDAGAHANGLFARMAGSVEQGWHYQADSIEELVARLDRVAASLSPCGYALDERPAAVTVSLDGEALPACTSADCLDGYAFEPDSGVVTLAPLTCRQAALAECPDIVIADATRR